MRIPTRSGVSLSEQEFHGVMEAVHRRINRLANLGHPDASVVGDQTFQAPPPGPPLQGDWSQMFQPQEDQDASQEPQAAAMGVRRQRGSMGAEASL